MKNHKGYLYTLEMLFAIAVIFGAILFVFRAAPDKPVTELGIIKQQGFDALRHMDYEGSLKKYAYENNETAIENELDSLISRGIGFEAEICQYDCSQSGIPENQTTMIVDYYVAGYRNSYGAKKVRLYLWRAY